MQQKFEQSIVAKITMLMSSVIVLTILIIFSTVVISEITDNDAEVVNISGSLRKDSYRIISAIFKGERNSQFNEVFPLVTEFTRKLNNPIFLSFDTLFDNLDVTAQFHRVQNHWQETLQPMIFALETNPASLETVVSGIEKFVVDLEILVTVYQHNAEQKYYILRLIGIFSFFVTILVALLAVYYIQVYVKQPLAELTENAEKLSHGDLSIRIPIENNDEFGFLAKTLNHSASVLANMSQSLEQRINEKTRELEHSNDRLNLLFTIARDLNMSTTEAPDYGMFIRELSRVSELPKINLCLADGKKIIQFGEPLDQGGNLNCLQRNYDLCIESQILWKKDLNLKIIRFDLYNETTKYGVLLCALEENQNLKLWQHRLLTSVTDQMATNLSMVEKSIHSNRLALLQERTIIARELHDSLAQSLSYLKFQVSILDKTLQKDREAPLVDQTIMELRKGLDSAYTQLRQLLTTFRLKVTGTDFKAALESAISTVNQNDQMQVELKYDLGMLKLTPAEQIHLLQISKEALQNACDHSNGDTVTINLVYYNNTVVRLSVHDNGIGIPDSPEKLDHFGLSIMNERSKSLNGELSIHRDDKNGTVVEFSFQPEESLHLNKQLS